jgi:hypothetical protein
MSALIGQWWFEYAAMLGAWTVAVSFLFGGYWFGREAWSEWLDEEVLAERKKGARFYGVGAARLEDRLVKLGRLGISGAWFELIVITATVLLLCLINFFLLPQAKLAPVVLTHWWWLLAAGLAIFLTVSLFSRGVTRGEIAKRRERLAERAAALDADKLAAERAGLERFETYYGRGYWLYNVYSTLIYAIALLGAVMVISQVVADYDVFQREYDRLAADESLLVQAMADFDRAASATSEQTSGLMSQVERVHARYTRVLFSIAHQINTVMLVALCVLFLTFVIEFTPARNTYTQTGLACMRWAVWASIGLVVAAGIVVYFGLYGGMIRDLYPKLQVFEDTVRAKAPTSTWETLRRYAEIVNELRSRQGPTGFMRAILTEQTVLVTGLGLLQQFYINRVRREARRDDLQAAYH